MVQLVVAADQLPELFDPGQTPPSTRPCTHAPYSTCRPDPAPGEAPDAIPARSVRAVARGILQRENNAGTRRSERAVAWILRAAWLVLPLTLGPALADGLDARATGLRTTASVGLWVLWSVGLLATLIPHRSP